MALVPVYLVYRFRQWEEPCSAPPKVTSGRKYEWNAEKGGQTSQLGRGYIGTKLQNSKEGSSTGQVTPQTWAEWALQEDSVGSSSQRCSGWDRRQSAVYMDTMNSMPKTRQLQTTTTETQNMCVKGRITHNIRFFYMAGPAGLQNPSLLWAGKATRGAF